MALLRATDPRARAPVSLAWLGEADPLPRSLHGGDRGPSASARKMDQKVLEMHHEAAGGAGRTRPELRAFAAESERRRWQMPGSSSRPDVPASSCRGSSSRSSARWSRARGARPQGALDNASAGGRFLQGRHRGVAGGGAAAVNARSFPPLAPQDDEDGASAATTTSSRRFTSPPTPCAAPSSFRVETVDLPRARAVRQGRRLPVSARELPRTPEGGTKARSS